MSYREVNLSEQTDKWVQVSVGNTIFESTQTERASRGGGLPIGNDDQVSRRFIQWRIEGDVLELIDTSLDHTMDHNKLRLRFGLELLLEVVHQETDQFLAIYVITVTNRTLHRFLFPHPSTLRYAGQSMFFDFSLSKRHGKYTACRGNTPTCMTKQEEDIVIGASNGGIYLEKISFEQVDVLIYNEEELIETSGISRIWFTKPTSSKVKALQCSATHIFALCADQRLRIWSMESMRIILTEEVSEGGWHDDGRQEKCDLLLYGDAPNIVVVQDMARETVFRTFTVTNFGGEFSLHHSGVTVCAHEQGGLVDVKTDGKLTWGLWKDKKGYVVRFQENKRREANSATADQWTEVIRDTFSSSLGHIPPTLSSAYLFESRLFAPGFLPARVIQQALVNYRGTIASRQQATTGSSLRREVVSAVQDKIVHEVAGDLENAPFVTHKQWEIFAEICGRVYNGEDLACGVFSHKNLPFTAVMKKGGISVLRPVSTLEALHCVMNSSQNIDDLQLDQDGDDIINFLKCVDVVVKRVGPRMDHYDEELLHNAPFHQQHAHTIYYLGHSRVRFEFTLSAAIYLVLLRLCCSVFTYAALLQA